MGRKERDKHKEREIESEIDVLLPDTYSNFLEERRYSLGESPAFVAFGNFWPSSEQLNRFSTTIIRRVFSTVELLGEFRESSSGDIGGWAATLLWLGEWLPTLVIAVRTAATDKRTHNGFLGNGISIRRRAVAKVY